MVKRILLTWLIALAICAILFVLLHVGLGGWHWDDPIFRRYAAAMILLLATATTAPIYNILWWRKSNGETS